MSGSDASPRTRPDPIGLLRSAQAEHGYLDDTLLARLTREYGIPLYELEGLVSFYPHFRRSPPPRVAVAVCRDVACAMRGGDALRARLEAEAAARPDVEVTPVSCLGRCDRAPACLVDDEPATPDALTAALDLSPGALESFTPPEISTDFDSGAATDPYVDPDEHYATLREWLASAPAPGPDVSSLLERIEASGLRGMGGAGFPTAEKWRAVASADGGPKVAICNADESEPGTFKDREILARWPHLLIEGLAFGAFCVGAERGIVFVRHEYGPETRALREAITRAREVGALGDDVFGSGRRFDVEVFVSPGGYILGEETALLEALEGRRGEPRHKPPFPGEVGLEGKPTLINNVETLCAVPRIVRGASADTKFFSVSGDVERPGVHEVPLGTTLAQLLQRCGGMRDGRELVAFLPGGASTGFLGKQHVDRPLEWQSLRDAGSALGSGAVIVVGAGADLRAIAGNLTAFFRNESCGKCVPCRLGSDRAVKWIEADAPLDTARLNALAELMADTSICGLGQVALTPVTSLLGAGLLDGGSGDSEDVS